MDTIKWCLEQKKGLRLVEPNENMSQSYIGMADESMESAKLVKSSKIWSATTAYYIFYYSLYALMLKIGVRSEIHSCSIEFMKRFLGNYYSLKDIEMFEKAFSARIDLQYYSNRPVDGKVIGVVREYSVEFFVKTKDILANITDNEIGEIRMRLK